MFLILAVVVAAVALTGRISFAPASSNHQPKAHNIATTVSTQARQVKRDVKRVVTDVAHRIGVHPSSRCSDASDPTGDDSSGACGDNGSDDQAGDNVRGGP